jgi:hypothetical protein
MFPSSFSSLIPIPPSQRVGWCCDVIETGITIVA